jgi:hypothetical protein
MDVCTAFYNGWLFFPIRLSAAFDATGTRLNRNRNPADKIDAFPAGKTLPEGSDTCSLRRPPSGSPAKLICIDLDLVVENKWIRQPGNSIEGETAEAFLTAEAIDTSMKHLGMNQTHQLSKHRAAGIHPPMVMPGGSSPIRIASSSNRSPSFRAVTCHCSRRFPETALI